MKIPLEYIITFFCAFVAIEYVSIFKKVYVAIDLRGNNGPYCCVYAYNKNG
jgi:hypothetical protein